MVFETTAVALSGTQDGSYYGSVEWGWRTDAAGALSQVPFRLISQGVPSAGFLAAAAAWNSATLRGTVVARHAPTSVYTSPGGAVAYTIAQNTVVRVGDAYGSGAVPYRQVTVRSGTHTGQTGYVQVSDLRDQADGASTVDLPTPDVHTLTTAQRLNDGISGPWRDTMSLAAGTRVVQTTDRPGSGVPATKVWVRVVDGPNTGANGYLDRAALRDELP
jgi:hypothetical protein